MDKTLTIKRTATGWELELNGTSLATFTNAPLQRCMLIAAARAALSAADYLRLDVYAEDIGRLASACPTVDGCPITTALQRASDMNAKGGGVCVGVLAQ